MHPLEVLFFLALILYTAVIWMNRFGVELGLGMVWLFGIGLMADLSGTVFLCLAKASQWTVNLHTVSGFSSLLIMALHFWWALLAVRTGGKFKLYFDRFSVWAWYFWMVAFASGLF